MMERNRVYPMIVLTLVGLCNATAWVAEGQLAHLFDPAKSGPLHLPFHSTVVSLG